MATDSDGRVATTEVTKSPPQVPLGGTIRWVLPGILGLIGTARLPRRGKRR